MSEDTKTTRRRRQPVKRTTKSGQEVLNLKGPLKASDEVIASARERNWPRKPQPVPEDTWVSDEEDKATVIRKYKDKVRNPMTGIRAFCCECMGGYIGEIKQCQSKDCALHPFRTGDNPYHTRKKKADDE